MVVAGRSARATLIEYGAPKPLLQEIALSLGLSRATLRDQILATGARVAQTLSLSSNPFSVSGSDVRVTDVAGLVRIAPRLELEISPKFLGLEWSAWREDFFFVSMLSRHGRLLANERLLATPGDRADLATLVAKAMISMFYENLRRPLRTYRHSFVSEFVIDGDVDPESVLLPEPDGYSQRIVVYDRRNVFNAAILAATQTLLPEVRDPQTRRQLTRIAEVLLPQPRIRRAQQRRVPSRAKRWQSLHDLSIDVLGGFGVTYDPAAVWAPGFVLDTWRVWEDLLTVAFRLAWGSAYIDSQKPIPLGVRSVVAADGTIGTRRISVIPDLRVGLGSKLLVDAKYKGRIDEERPKISDADLYEALAFAAAAKQRQVVLLYPAIARGVPSATGTTSVFERVSIGDVAIVGMEVEVRGISRVGALRQFATRIRDALRPFTTTDLAA